MDYQKTTIRKITGNEIGGKIYFDLYIPEPHDLWVELKFGNKRIYKALNNPETIPLEFASEIPTTTSGTMTVTIETWVNEGGITSPKWVFVGKDTKQHEIHVNEVDASPFIDSASVSPWVDSPNDPNFGFYSNKGTAKFEFKASPGVGATINNWELTFDGRKYKQTGGDSFVVISDRLSVGEELLWEMTVRDTRQREGFFFGTITSREYEYPDLGTVEVKRCLEDGVEDAMGSFLKIVGAPTVFSNTYEINLLFKQNGVYVPASKQGDLYKDFPAEQAFDIRIDIDDKIAPNPFSYYMFISSADCLMNVTENAIAFGKYSQEPNTFEVFMDLGTVLKQKIKDIVSPEVENILGVASAKIRKVNSIGEASETGEYLQIYNAKDNVWEWVNTPNKLGIEYRTARTYLDKPVYACKIDVPIANNGSINHILQDTQIIIIDHTLRFKSNDGQYHLLLPYLDPQYPIYLSLRGRGVMVHKNTGWGDGRIYGTVYYTKGVPV